MTRKVWGGRFREETDALVDRFNASVRFDRRLYAQDIDGSMAHCRMLARQGIVTEEEASRIVAALAKIRRDLERGTLQIHESDEDIHSVVEKALVEKIGALGEKLHTGRSRNDQVATDTRLFVREALGRADRLIQDNQIALLGLAERHFDIVMPGYTHLQRAQPVLLAHHLLAYYEMFRRDRQRFQESFKRVNVCPLGSAALAGSTFPLDRETVARELGFDEITRNSVDAVSDRDFVLEYLFNASVLMMHLSRFAEELVLWSSQEFGFVQMPDAFCTGSSIMPQKKNPDVPELVRGKSGRVYGHLMGLLTTMKGLPLAYNKDMQEDKEALFDAVDTLESVLEVMAALVSRLSFNGERMRDAVRTGHLAATDLADYLVRKGLPFRKAHETAGKIVLYAIEQKRELHELTFEELQAFSRKVDPDALDWLDPLSCPERRNLPGGTGPEAVRQSIEKAKAELAG
jgi:argininosuccinate lyase